jgi:hypothetical protein
MMKIQVNNQCVVKLLRGLRPFKATGPDEIPAYILKNMAAMLLITKDLVTIEVVHDGTMDNVLQ